jgi:type IV secretory pathway TraG/TraD family ATPase VirD4
MQEKSFSDIEFFLQHWLGIFAHEWFSLSHQFIWVWGFVGGISLVIVCLSQVLIVRKLSLLALLISVSMGPIVYFIIGPFSELLLFSRYSMAHQYMNIYIICFVLGGVAWIFVARQLILVIDAVKRLLTKQTVAQRDGRSDVRRMSNLLPAANVNYDPKKYFRKGKMFFGLDERRKPQYIITSDWRSSHCDLIGTTGSGKGVAAGVLIAQAISQNEAVFVIDPKDDEFLPHLLGQEAKNNSKQFYYINLSGDLPQWNPFAHKSLQEIEELLAGAFGQTSQGGIDDFYRGKDRACSRLFAEEFIRQPSTVNDIYLSLLKSYPDAMSDAAKFNDDLAEIAAAPVVNIIGGFDIRLAIDDGAVVYIKGSMRSPRVQKLQKIFVLSLMQHCENRDREGARSVAIFLDEFKYLISRPALEALGAIRDKGAHIILAHQSIGDLKDCPSDIDPQSVVSSVNENCSLKLGYRINDPDTADWLSRMSGQILVDDETRIFESVPAFAEVKSSNRHLRLAERPLIDTNMLHSLPKGCAVLFGAGLARLVFVSPVRVKKSHDYLSPTVFTGVAKRVLITGSVSKGIEGLIDVD